MTEEYTPRMILNDFLDLIWKESQKLWPKSRIASIHVNHHLFMTLCLGLDDSFLPYGSITHEYGKSTLTLMGIPVTIDEALDQEIIINVYHFHVYTETIAMKWPPTPPSYEEKR